jgi:hypothetical protein
MAKGYMIEKFEEESVFIERMKNFDEDTIECTSHTLFRLSEKQRKIFTCDVLKRFLLDNEPLKVGIQYNGNYAVYYNFKGKQLMKIILSVKPDKIRIVTFKILDKSQLPR